MVEDVFFKKTIPFKFWKHELQFKTSQTLFSSHDVDAGTRLLLRTVVEAGGEKPSRILDMGCGYGALGLTLQSLYPQSYAQLVDRDALAVEYSRLNATLNGLENVECYGSLGYDDVERADYDLVVSNIPGKAGEHVIAYLLREATYYLAPEGRVAVVVVSALREFVERTLSATPGLEITLRKSSSEHSVFHYRFITHAESRPSATAFERGIYHRGSVLLHIGDNECKVETVYGLPEFDSLSYSSGLLINTLAETASSPVRTAAVLRPGQGHVAVALARAVAPQKLILIDRDLLALRTGAHNLAACRYPITSIATLHQVDAQTHEPVDLFFTSLGDDGRAVDTMDLRQAVAALSNGGRLLVAGESTPLTRLIGEARGVGLRVERREKGRGQGVAVLKAAG